MSVVAPATELSANPLREGLEQERVPEASCLVIFGASGDLTQRKLIPALYSLAHDGLLPAGQTIIGFARPEYTDDAFRMAMRAAESMRLRTIRTCSGEFCGPINILDTEPLRYTSPAEIARGAQPAATSAESSSARPFIGVGLGAPTKGAAFAR